MSPKRRKFTPRQKVQMLRQHFLENKPVSDVCDEHGINPVQFYRWQKLFFEKGELAFEKSQDQKNKRNTFVLVIKASFKKKQMISKRSFEWKE